MTSIRLDTQGRLLEYLRVPPQFEHDPATDEQAAPAVAADEPDWALLFEAAELDMETFRPAKPEWVPPVYADRRAAWTGPLASLEGVELRIEAAAYRGQPVYFELIGPWSRAARQVSVENTARSRANQIVGVSVLLLVVFGGAWVARRNLRAGRGDSQGALRIALALLAVSGGAWALLSHHPPRLVSAIVAFVFMLGIPLFIAIVAWTLYVALEPYMRRNRPHWLVSWNRLLRGNFRDPLVGRDLLIGAAVGAALAALGALSGVLGLALEPDVTTPTTMALQPIAGLGSSVGWLLSSIQGTTFVTILFVFLWFLFRLILRSDRIAAGLVIVLFAFTSAPAPGGFSWVSLAAVLLIALVLVFVTSRYGLLALVAGTAFGSGITNQAVALDFTLWWVRGSWLCLLIVAALAVWAYRTGLGGRSARSRT